MEWLVTLVCACVGSTGFFAFVQFLVNRKDGRKKEIQELTKQMKKLQDTVINANREQQIAITKVQLQVLFYNDPKNTDTILQVAKHYFVELGGDGEMANLFSQWAETNQVDIGWFRGKIK